ncbi:NAD(P)-binding protein [Thozetella sp. PMI_491]|nr:NAD(P)-binding protein [Thozetella sp. PMI_491]
MSYTKTSHSTTYPAISPANPAVSASGKTVLITGGGNGIGLSTARSFAAAGASRVVLVGRREAVLTQAADGIRADYPGTTVQAHAVDVRDNKAVAAVFSRVGSVDIVVHGAAAVPSLIPLMSIDPDELWGAFETNVRGTLNVARALLASRAEGSEEAVLLVVNTAGVLMPPMPKMGGYVTSKAPAMKIVEYLGAESVSKMRVMSVHPGVVRTDAALVLEENGIFFPSYDDVSLPSDFLVWAASEEAAFLRNKYVFANWDVDELKARKEEIQSGLELTLGLNGFPRAA